MWTCGIAIATQQATPATHNIACSALGERPAAVCAAALKASAAAPPSLGARRRTIGTNGSMASAHTAPTAICVARQPSTLTKCCRSGGQITPPI